MFSFGAKQPYDENFWRGALYNRICKAIKQDINNKSIQTPPEISKATTAANPAAAAIH
jgi:hypothetical protein